MDRLPLDIVMIIGCHLPIKSIIRLTVTSKKYYKVKDRLLNVVTKINFKSLTQELRSIYIVKFNDILCRFDNKICKEDTIKRNIYDFQWMVSEIMKLNVWYLYWKDLEQNIRDKLINWLSYSSTISGNKFEAKEYVLETLLITLWKLRKIVGQLFPFSTNLPFSPYLHNFILKGKFSFRLSMVILNKLTMYKYPTLVDLYASKYYYKKKKEIRVINVNEKTFDVLTKIKFYNPKLYYMELNKLRLSPKQWTQIFLHEFQKIKENNYFTSKLILFRYFSDKPLRGKYLKKIMGRDDYLAMICFGCNLKL